MYYAEAERKSARAKTRLALIIKGDKGQALPSGSLVCGATLRMGPRRKHTACWRRRRSRWRRWGRPWNFEIQNTAHRGSPERGNTCKRVAERGDQGRAKGVRRKGG
ncbi:hypothetical protein GSI_11886 [Ganoderma sinense ZZ0214-1]|uniref:Uncharacterized protein n=1 Tax=Ganoderma sinense ZZ0214-1 TaxID=1077348 RepID=A0A2G8RX88_9APHY|nr:hypothetical protein GSI_11886 [Ganoderma sinense ZZ0214-1]